MEKYKELFLVLGKQCLFHMSLPELSKGIGDQGDKRVSFHQLKHGKDQF